MMESALQEKLERLSYGLENIQERVEDMAGIIKIRTSPRAGVAVDTAFPLKIKWKGDCMSIIIDDH